MAPRSRSRSAFDEDEDLPSGSPAVSDDVGIQPSLDTIGIHKRRRLNNDSPTTAAGDDSWILDPPRTMSGSNQHLADHSRLSSAPGSVRFKVGQIVRVYMKNFVTYTEAVVYPGPTLNMVIGPNGTGKSTLVCAICLGLGFRPDVLGRAKDVGEFVKMGFREATIEVELQGEDGSQNTTIRRIIKKEGNKSAFAVNGESANNKKVLDVARSFNIQVDNLCHFLPQDRVVEFSRLSPIDLLEQTLKAVAPAAISDDFQQLKSLREDQRAHEGRDSRQESLLNSLRSKQEAQRVEVETMRERDALRGRLEMLEACRPLAEMRERKAHARETKSALRDLEIRTRQLAERLQPSLAEEQHKGEYLNHIKAVLEARQAKVKSKNVALEKVFEKDLAKADRMISELRSKKTAHIKTLNEQRHEVSNYENVIRKIDAEIAKGAPDIDLATLNERIRYFDRQIDSLKREIRDINERRDERNPEIRDRRQRIKAIDDHLENLNTTAGRSGQKLQQHARDAALAWDYVKERRDQFQGPIYGPAVLECTVDKKWSGVLETLVREGDLTAITVTNREDFKILSNMVYSSLGKKMVTLRSTTHSRNDFKKPLSVDDETLLQVKHYAIDLIDGPDAVLAMLCETSKLHSTPVYEDALPAEVYDRIQRCEAVSNVMTLRERFEIRRRKEYGVQSMSMQAIRQAKYWNEDAIDGNVVSEARNSQAKLKSELEELEKCNEADKVVQQQKQQNLNALEEERQPIEEERNEQHNADKRWKGLPSRKETASTSLIASEEKYRELEREINVDIYEEENRLVQTRTLRIHEMAGAIHKLQADMALVVEAQIAKIEAESDYEQFKEQNKDSNDTYNRIKLQEQEARGQVAQAREAYKAAADKLRDGQSITREVSEFFGALNLEEPRCLHFLELEISSTTARIEMIAGGNEGAIAQFEDRAKRIERATEELAVFQGESRQLLNRISEIRARFEPFADRMVDDISAAFASEFAKINCTGAVELFKNAGEKEQDDLREDGANFDRWSIDILVSFRKDAPLQKLDSHRQSGGERAVSTIFYLMALQSTSKAPFRIVDEINQGMDPRNERVVHGRLVKIACGEGASDSHDGGDENEVDGDGEGEEGDRQGSQYFLITPKLLTGLDYIRGMKVHCIASGEHMPRDPKAVDLRALASRARHSNLGRLRPIAAGA